MELTHHEVVERLDEGLRKASSRSRELAAATKNNAWLLLAKQIDMLLHNGHELLRMKSLTRQETLAALDRRAASLATDNKDKEKQ